MKLTAFALGELDAAERAQVEKRLAENPEDRRFVDQVRLTAQLVSDELSHESPAGLDAIHYAAIEMRLRDPDPATKQIDRRAIIRGRIGLYISVAASVAIVCIAIGAILASLFRHGNVAVVAPTTLPTNPIIIAPDSPATLDHALEHGAARAPAGADPFVTVAENPVSTFLLNTDSASYDEVRRALFNDRLPSPESIRIEGLINAFDYDDTGPGENATFAGHIEVGQCPWQRSHRLARVAIKARSGSGNIAQAVRAEVTFNPAFAKSYRLLGYGNSGGGPSVGETIAAGHAVTALYEVVPLAAPAAAADFLTLRVRYRLRESAREQWVQFAGHENLDAPNATADFEFAAALAEFGMLLRNTPARGQASLDGVIQLAEAGRGPDPGGRRREFIELVRRAKDLTG